MMLPAFTISFQLYHFDYRASAADIFHKEAQLPYTAD